MTTPESASDQPSRAVDRSRRRGAVLGPSPPSGGIRKGKFAPLHVFNPCRLAFIREQALARFERDARLRAPFEGLTLLDIGCGGGLLAEPMARLGFTVTAIDASENIKTAAAHAAEQGLAIGYRAAPPPSSCWPRARGRSTWC
jgi:SAM-dependent methyltransferase